LGGTPCRRGYAIDQIETVPMTAEQYDQAINALTTLIVKWAASLRGHGSMAPGHSGGD
jgi:hypothetical protein